MKWEDLPNRAQADLLEWYNVATPDDDDKQRLADLYADGKFHAWNCPSCETRVYWGEPDDWDHFQGVCQADFVSYPGSPEYYSPWMVSRQCDSCRMTVPTMEDLYLIGESSPSCWSEYES